MAQSENVTRPDRLERYRRTAAMRKEISDRVIDYEDDIIKELIRDYGAGQLTEMKMYGAIGELTALRRLVDDMETELAQEA